MKSVEEHSYPMKTLRESTLLLNHLILTFERASRVENDKDLKKALMTIMIVGGGPTGVEEAGARQHDRQLGRQLPQRPPRAHVVARPHRT